MVLCSKCGGDWHRGRCDPGAAARFERIPRLVRESMMNAIRGGFEPPGDDVSERPYGPVRVMPRIAPEVHEIETPQQAQLELVS